MVLAAALAGCALLTLNGCFAAPAGPDGKAIAAEIEEEVAEFFVEADEARQVRAILIYHDGEPVLEQYTAADASDYWDTRSVTKSVVSALIGIAIGQGLISGVDATLGELLPSFAADMTPDVAAITLEQLLTQTENFPADRAAAETFWSSPDWVRAILAQRAAAGPGDGEFLYSNAGSHLLSAVLMEATGGSVLDFAREYFFEPLAIKTEPATDIVLGVAEDDDGPDTVRQYNAAGFTWPVDPQGFNTGAAFLQLRPQVSRRSASRISPEEGRLKGAQVIPGGVGRGVHNHARNGHDGLTSGTAICGGQKPQTAPPTISRPEGLRWSADRGRTRP